MPTYIHRCGRCGAEFDLVLSIERRDDGAYCAECGGKAVRQFTGCHLKMPHSEWCEISAREFLGPKDEEARERVTVTKGSPKVRPRL